MPSATKPARILIADDHALLRRGLRAIIADRPEWSVCAEAGSGREAVEKAREAQPDVAILDYAMPELNGLEAATRIRAASPAIQLLIVTMHDTEEIVREALAVGVHGFILKSDAERELADALDALLAGKPYYSGRISQLILRKYLKTGDTQAGAGADAVRLSPREGEVLRLIAQGRSTRDVATQLRISPKTAETHRTNVMRKLNVHSVTEVVRFAIRNKLVEP